MQQRKQECESEKRRKEKRREGVGKGWRVEKTKEERKGGREEAKEGGEEERERKKN